MTTIEKKIIIDKLFSFANKDITHKLQIDSESMSYITIPTDTKKINMIIEKHMKPYCPIKDSTIVDGTGGAGGDTIAFGHNFNNVISIELDIQRYEYLKNNVNAYNYKNVHVMNGDCTVIIPKLRNIDIIYMDPPWGGKHYKEKSDLRLELSDMNIESVIKLFFDPVQMSSVPHIIVLKLPKNYDLKYLFETLNSDTSTKYDICFYEIRKILIVVIEKIINKSHNSVDITQNE